MSTHPSMTAIQNNSRSVARHEAATARARAVWERKSSRMLYMGDRLCEIERWGVGAFVVHGLLPGDHPVQVRLESFVEASDDDEWNAGRSAYTDEGGFVLSQVLATVGGEPGRVCHKIPDAALERDADRFVERFRTHFFRLKPTMRKSSATNLGAEVTVRCQETIKS